MKELYRMPEFMEGKCDPPTLGFFSEGQKATNYSRLSWSLELRWTGYFHASHSVARGLYTSPLLLLAP